MSIDIAIPLREEASRAQEIAERMSRADDRKALTLLAARLVGSRKDWNATRETNCRSLFGAARDPRSNTDAIDVDQRPLAMPSSMCVKGSGRGGVMPAKTQIVDFLGDKALVMPALLDAAILGNERAKYVLSLFQMAASYAEHPQEGCAASLRTDREACGIADASFNRNGIAGHLEWAADALLRASLVLRDHVLGEVMFV